MREKKRQDIKRPIIAKIIKLTKLRMTHPGGPSIKRDPGLAETIRTKNNQYLRDFQKSLFGLAIDELREVLEELKTNKDSHGAAHNELADEKVLRTVHAAETPNDDAPEDYNRMWTGSETSTEHQKKIGLSYRVTPEGHGSASDEEDLTADPADHPTHAPKPQGETNVEDKWVEAAIHEIITTRMVDDGSGHAKCFFCNEQFATPLGAQDHLLEQYNKGRRLWQKQLTIDQLTAEIMQSDTLILNIPADPSYKHYKAVLTWVGVVKSKWRGRAREFRYTQFLLPNYFNANNNNELGGG